MKLSAGKIATLLPLLLLSAAAPAANIGNIMPLGDSITEGLASSGANVTPGGYRTELYTALTNAGCTFTFVGSSTDNPSPLLTSVNQTHNEGHSGFTIDNVRNDGKGIDEHLPTWLGASGPSTSVPLTILLMIGTNDINSSNGSGSADTGDYRLTAVSRLDHLIADIVALRPTAHLIVATIPVNKNTAAYNGPAAVDAYNAGVLTDVQKHQALGQNVSYFDMHAVLTTADLVDTLHPTTAGYNKMGDAWANAVMAKSFAGKNKIVDRNSGKSVVVQGASTVNSAPCILYTFNGTGNDEWTAIILADGHYEFQNVHSGLAMVVQSASTAPGAPVIQYSFGGANTNDEWDIHDLGTGYYQITNVHSGLSLDVKSSGTANGTIIDQATHTSGNNQQFQLISVP